MDTGALKQQVRDALLDAFRTSGEMQITVSNASLGTAFNNFLAVPGTTYTLAVFNLLEWIESQNLLVQFLKTARRDNPGNARLAAVMAKFTGLEQIYDSLSPLGVNGQSLPFEQAEAIVLKQVRFEDIGPWLETLGRMRRAVCRIEPQPQIPGDPASLNGYGTGFLVAPDVVMTNFHVAESFWSDPVASQRVRVRFDFERPTPASVPSTGNEYTLAMQWEKEPQKGDPREHPWQCLASPFDKLDFALLRLETAAAKDIVGSSKREPLSFAVRDFTDSDPILILQHPNAEPLKLSFGSVTALDPPNHVRYLVNTLGGSSGSPCLTQDLKVGALHHAGPSGSNRGVKIGAITSFLRNFREQLKAMKLDHLI